MQAYRKLTAHLIHETSDRFRLRVRIKRSRSGTPADRARRQPKSPSPLDLVPQKLEPLRNMHDPRLLRMQLHTQFAQDPKGRSYGRARLRRGLAGDYPVIRVPRKLITLAPHLSIEWRQENVTEQPLAITSTIYGGLGLNKLHPPPTGRRGGPLL